MKNLFYKIIRGYSSEDYVEITGEELEKAYFAFLAKKDAVYSGGAVRGSEIMAIQPDYHRTMGWNRGYKMDALDWGQLKDKGIDNEMRLKIEKSKERVEYFISTKQEHLIGKNTTIPELENKTNEVRSLAGGLAEKMRIK